MNYAMENRGEGFKNPVNCLKSLGNPYVEGGWLKNSENCLTKLMIGPLGVLQLNFLDFILT